MCAIEFRKFPLDRKCDIVEKNNLCRHCLNKHKCKCFARKDKMAAVLSIINCYINLMISRLPDKTTLHKQITLSVKQSIQIFRILPIRLYKRNGYISTYAFLDEGSSVPLIEKEVFDLLDLDGEQQSLCLRWTDNTKYI